MKKNYIYIILVSLITISCNKDDLNLYPQDRVTDESFWNTPNDFQLAVNTMYSTLPGHSRTDIDSDIAFAENPNTVGSGTNLATANSGTWNGAYSRIRHLNNIIEQAIKKPEIDASRWVAEAKFFRAMNYAKLVRIYGDVPLILSVLSTSSEEELNMKRTPRSEVIDVVLNDLTEAALDLPLHNAMAGDEKGRITKGAALSLKARIALHEGTWSKYHQGGKANERFELAIKASKDVIDSGQYNLYNGNGLDSYRLLFLPPGDDSNESILHRRYYADISTHNFSNSVQANWSATRKLVDMYLDNTGLPIDHPSSSFVGYTSILDEYKNRDPRLSNTIGKIGDVFADHSGNTYTYGIGNITNYTVSGYRIRKFQSDDSEIRLVRKEFSDHHIIRYPEVLLIYAEALFEKNGTISDADLDKSINVIRDRVNMPHLSNAFVNGNGLNMITEIRRERTIELAFEGFRLDDLKRWKIAETELREDIKGFRYTGTEWESVFPLLSDFNTSATLDQEGNIIIQPSSSRFFTNKHYLFPLPLQQIQLNPNLIQNPGW